MGGQKADITRLINGVNAVLWSRVSPNMIRKSVNINIFKWLINSNMTFTYVKIGSLSALGFT